YDDFSKFEEYIEAFKILAKSTRGIRRLGAAALDLAYLSSGRFDGFYEYALSPWDVAAGSLLVKEAGGFVSDFKGGSNFLFGEQIIASNTHIHEELLDLIKKSFQL